VVNLATGVVAGLVRICSAARYLRGAILAVGLIALGSVGVFSRVQSYALVGWDSYPIILTSRITSVDRLGEIFTDKLMGDRHPAVVYRPAFSLSVAADYAIWGLNARGYQLTNTMWFAVASFGAWMLFRKLFGGQEILGPILALGVFLFHPTHFEVIPVLSRRPELMASAFMCCSLAALVPGDEKRSGRRYLLSLVWFILALSAKETAMALPVVSAAVLILYSPRSGGRQRVGTVVKRMLPYMLILLSYIAIRFAVLGSLGGHARTSFGRAVERAPSFSLDIVELLVAPISRVTGLEWAEVLGVAAVASGLVVMMLKPWKWFASEELGSREWTSDGNGHGWRPIAVSLVWLGLFSATYVVAGAIQPWYIFSLTVGWALLLGACASAFVRLADRWHSARGRSLAAVALLCSISLITWQSQYSPVLWKYAEWERGSVASDRFLRALERELGRAGPGAVVLPPIMPSWALPPPEGPAISGGAVLNTYSVEAWAELVYPDRAVSVVRRGEGRVFTSDRIWIVVEPGAV
jgi:hypothetical protein